MNTQLTSDSTVGELPLQDFQVSPTILGQVVANQFEQQPDLPGVIVADDRRLLGMISRRRFHEQISHPYGRELFLKRPIHALLDVKEQKVRHLQLPDTEKVDAAVQMALTRPFEEVYEPLVIVFKDDKLPEFKVYFLLNCQTLLLAQSQILTVVNSQLKQETLRSQNYLVKLKQQRQKINDYTQLLKQQKTLIQERNALLEKQQSELVNKLKEIAELNQLVMQIGQIISLEGKKAFHATFDGVNAICSNINQIVDIGRLLSEELETIDSTSKLVEKVSKQVRHLAVQATIVANHAGKELRDFSHITTEIGKLVSQTSEAGQQMKRVADRFMLKVQELTSAAEAGKTVARSLVKKNDQAEAALAELETLVQNQHSGGVTAVTTGDIPEGTQALTERRSQVECTSQLQEMRRYKDSGQLIQKIEKALNHHKNYSV